MTSMNPSMPTTSTKSLGTGPSYTPHDNMQLPGLDQGGTGNQAETTGSQTGGFRSVGDYASSGNYVGGTGNSDEPLDVKQAAFNMQPYLRRPFGPQEM